MENIKRLRELIDRPPPLHAMLDGAAVSIITTDKRGLIVSLNRRAEALLGYITEEVLGKDLKMVVSNSISLLEPMEGVHATLHTKLHGDMEALLHISFVDLAVDERLWVVQVIHVVMANE